MNEQTDIVQDILADREKGAARLVAEYRDRLYSAAFALCRDEHEAEDLVFCTLERVLAKIASYKDQESFYEWMYVILLNIYRNSVRGKMARNVVPVGGIHEMDILTEPLPPDSVVHTVDGDIVRQVLEKMPGNMREVLLLRYFMDMPIMQIAKFLMLPVGTVKSRLYYARMALANHFGIDFKCIATALALGAFLLMASATAIYGMFGGDGDVMDGAAETVERTDAASRGKEAPAAMPDPPAAGVQETSPAAPAPKADAVPSFFSTTKGERPMTRKKTAVAALTAAMAAAPLASARGDECQFIILGDPVAAAAARSSSASSETGTLTSGTLADGRVLDSPLEGRCRTKDDSPARRLRSDKFHGIFIRIR